MQTKTIACINCGTEGEMEVAGLNSNIPSARIFRHRGHNPFSGHMHYQCPACAIVLLVDPLSILANGSTVHPLSGREPYEAAGMGRAADAFSPMIPFDDSASNPHAVLRFLLRHCGARQSTSHSS